MRSQKVLIISFLALISVSFLAYNILAPQLGLVNRENRLLTSFPDVAETPIEMLPAAFNEYVDDNSPFRNQLVGLNAAINYNLFGTMESDQVLLGKEGWLFFKDGPADAPMGNYQGTVFFSEEEYVAAVHDAAVVDSWFRERGKRLVVFIAPSKDVVYAEYIPDDYPVVNTHSRTDEFVERLREETEATVLFPLDVLLAAKSSGPVYFKYDAHWNTRGALAALDCLFKTIGLETQPIGEYDFVRNERPHEGDLANLGAIYDFCLDDYDYTVERYSFTERDGRSIAIFRDSFATFFTPFLDARFETWTLREFAECSLATAGDADIVVLAVTERNLHEVLGMLAMLRGEIEAAG